MSRRTGSKAGVRRDPDRAAFVLIAGAFVVATSFLAAVLNVWVDEYYTLGTIAGTFAQTLDRALRFEAQAPLYFLLVGAVHRVLGSVFAARAFSIACMTLALVATRAAARRYAPAVPPNVAVALVACNPFAVWAAVEMRVYALAALLGSVFLVSFYDAFLAENSERRRPPAVAAFVATAIAGLYAQYFFGALLVAGGAVLALRRAWPAFRAYVAACAVVAVAALPLAAMLHEQLTAAAPSSSNSSLLRGIWVVATLCDYLVPHGWAGDWHERLPRELPYALACALAVAAIVARRPSTNLETRALATLVVATAAVLYAGVAVAGIAFVAPRHGAAAFVATVLLAAALAWSGTRRPAARAAYAAVVGLAYAATFVHDYGSLAKTGDWRRVAAYLDAHDRGSPVAVFPADAVGPLSFYYHGPARLVALPRDPSPDAWSLEQFRFRNEADARASLARAGRGPVWLVVTDDCTYLAAYYGCAFLDRAVAASYRVASREHFFGSTVLELAPPASVRRR